MERLQWFWFALRYPPPSCSRLWCLLRRPSHPNDCVRDEDQFGGAGFLSQSLCVWLSRLQSRDAWMWGRSYYCWRPDLNISGTTARREYIDQFQRFGVFWDVSCALHLTFRRDVGDERGYLNDRRLYSNW